MRVAANLAMDTSLSVAETELHALMLTSLAGNAHAYRVLLSQLAVRLRTFYGRRLGRDAADLEDLVQETLLAVHSRRATYDRGSPVTGWVYAIARYKLIDFLRRRKVRAALGLDDCEELFTADDNEQVAAARDVAQLLANLSERQREAIQLTRIEGLSTEEAALRSGQSESLIKVSVHRGLKRLMALYASNPPGKGDNANE
jgi:RNA polymerase sigma-70 factor (ECF subfamily)